MLDSSRNWWKVKNAQGQVGYVPYTLLKDIEEEHYDKVSNIRTGGFSFGFPRNRLVRVA